MDSNICIGKDWVAINKIKDMSGLVIGYTLLNIESPVSQYIDEFRLRSILLNNSKKKKEDIKLNIINLSTENGINVIESDDHKIDLEQQFYYKLITMENKHGEKIIGWQLRVIEKPVGRTFKCPSIYHGYPVISLENTFGKSSNKDVFNGSGMYQTFVNNRIYLDLSKMNTCNILTVKNMFGQIALVEKLNMKEWTLPKVENTDGMLLGCYKLKELNIEDLILPDNISKESIKNIFDSRAFGGLQPLTRLEKVKLTKKMSSILKEVYGSSNFVAITSLEKLALKAKMLDKDITKLVIMLIKE